MTVLAGPWPGTTVPVDGWRRMYLNYPTADLRETIERICPEALEGLHDVEERSLSDILRDVRALYDAHPTDHLEEMIAGLERRITTQKEDKTP